MDEKTRQFNLIYVLLGTFLIVGLLPVVLTGWLLSRQSEQELRGIEGRYQSQLLQDKARQIEMFGRRYVDLVSELGRAFELAGGLSVLERQGTEKHLTQTLKNDPNLVGLSIRPVRGNPYNVFRVEALSQAEVDAISDAALSNIRDKELVIGAPQLLPQRKEIVISFASPIVNDEGTVTAAVVGVVSLQDISKIFQQTTSDSESELLSKGLPVVFMIDRDGKTLAHPDTLAVINGKNMTGYKIVEDWLETGDRVQAGLSPFILENDGEQRQLIGAFATAALDKKSAYGIIAIQDETAALASVSQMRNQIWLISILACGLALGLGTILAKELTRPVLTMVDAAQKIADGDFTTRIEVRSRTELGTLGDAFNAMSDQIHRYINELQRAANDNREQFVGTVKALAAAIDGKDPYTRGHSERVSRLSVVLGERLKLDQTEIEKLRISALLHDIGKIGVDDRILKKPGSLTDEEFFQVKQHPYKGYKILQNIPAMKDYLPGIYMHHEAVDGSGYPQGLRGKEIPLQAKIISVADTFDAMTIDRPYQKGMTIAEAVERIGTFIGKRYDEQIVRALMDACEEGQVSPGRIKMDWKIKNFVRSEEQAESHFDMTRI